MTKFLLPLLLLVGAAAPAMAAPAQETPVAFERDGVRYVATVKTVDGATIISGREVDTGKTFVLRAQNGRVRGTYGTAQVSYIVGR